MDESKAESLSMEAITEFVADNIPEDWTLAILIQRGQIDIHLKSPDGDRIENLLDFETVAQTVNDYVNHARESDGLLPAYLPGLDPDDA